MFFFLMYGSRKYPGILPPQKGLEISGRRGGGGVTKAQKFKAMYEAKLEFPEGWGEVGVIGQIPSVGGGGGGLWIFSGTTQ